MHETLIKIQKLINNNKNKKAITLLKKINSKSPNYHSYNLEGLCYFNNKQYILAIPRFDKALLISPKSTEQTKILFNLAACYLQSENNIKAIEYLKKSLDIDSSIDNSLCRLKLGEIAFAEGQFDLVFQYIPNLLNSTIYANEALLMLLRTSFIAKDRENKLFYSKKVLAEAHNYSSLEAKKTLTLSQKLNHSSLTSDLISILEKKLNHESWFNEFQQSLNFKKSSVKFKLPKQKVLGENLKLISTIQKLLDNNIKLGASFHDSLRIFEENGNLSIKVFLQNVNNETLLNIPLKCMPLMCDFHIDLDSDDQIILLQKENMLNPSSLATMESMISIYNQTNKISTWKKSSPFFTLKNNIPLLSKLVDSKKNAPYITKYIDLLESGKENELALDSFFGSRAFIYKKEDLAESDIHITTPSEYGLLSVIDFLNHKVNGNHYLKEVGKVCVSGHPEETSNELFVHYNNFDPVLTYLIYGFVDTQAPWLFSVPIQVKTSNNIMIDILGNSGNTNTETISNDIDYIKDYAPNLSTKDNISFKADKIVVPDNKHNHLLRDSLKAIISSIDVNKDFKTSIKMENEILHLELQIIKMNLTYWYDIEKQNNNEVSELTKLINTAISHIKSYSNSLGLILF